jgi:hypothetical protein
MKSGKLARRHQPETFPGAQWFVAGARGESDMQGPLLCDAIELAR